MARHIEQLNIESFRGISNLELKGFSDINIFLGANNCGKTSVLEALMLIRKPDDFANIVQVARQRELVKLNLSTLSYFFDSFKYLFDKSKSDMLISVSAILRGKKVFMKLQGKMEDILIDVNEIIKNSKSKKNLLDQQEIIENEKVNSFIGELFFEAGRSYQLSNIENEKPSIKDISFNKYDKKLKINRDSNVIEINFISTIDHIVKNAFKSILQKKELKEDVVELLKSFDPNIVDLRIIQEDSNSFSQIIDNSVMGYLPLSVYGDGIKKVITLANGIIESKNGILLVDEIETSIHFLALNKVFSWLINACRKYNVQLFLTTHSLETVDELINCDTNSKNEDLMRIITLYKKENQTVARIISGDKALQVREEYNMELRT